MGRAPAGRKGFAEEAFGLKLEVLAGVSQVTVRGELGRGGIYMCRKAWYL